MKNLIKHSVLMLASALMITMVSCQNEDTVEMENLSVSGQVSFGIDVVDMAAGGRQQGAAPSSIKATILDNSGEVVVNFESIDLVSFDGEYVSAPLTLEPGSYTLTEFIILDSDDEAIYATPHEGSDLAYLVTSPLPIDFVVESNAVELVTPQVLSTDSHEVGDFGFANFALEVVSTFDIKISVFTIGKKGHDVSSASIEIEYKNKAFYTGELDAGVNLITLGDVENGQYDIKISKKGYDDYSEKYTVDELKEYVHTPLKVFLIED